MESPFTPGVGLEPRFLAGRSGYISDYSKRLGGAFLQGKNTLIIGLRGVGKSVLLKAFAKEALQNGWVPVHRELSKRSNNEDELIHGILAEVALRLKGVTISYSQRLVGFGSNNNQSIHEVNLEHLMNFFHAQPGDKGDKFQAVLKYSADIVAGLTTVETPLRGIVLMLDEFQLLEDKSDNYSLSLVMEAVSRLQSSTTTPIHAVFAGLPTMVGKMVESKPHAERLFSNVVNLGSLSKEDTEEAIWEPLRQSNNDQRFSKDLVEYIAELSTGYPYFVQYFSHMAFTTFRHSPVKKVDLGKILEELYAQLDETFYSGRLYLLSGKERAVALASSDINAPFSPSELLAAVRGRGAADVSMAVIQQYLIALQNKNVIYKVRRGTYDYALPLFSLFLKRCLESEEPNSVLQDLGSGGVS